MSKQNNSMTPKQRKAWLSGIVDKARDGNTSMSDAIGRAALVALNEMHQESRNNGRNR